MPGTSSVAPSGPGKPSFARNALRRLKRWLHVSRDRAEGRTSLNVIKTFPIYVPNSAGPYGPRAALTVQSINELMPLLAELQALASGQPAEFRDIGTFGHGDAATAVSGIKELFDRHGSDKSTRHEYHRLYGSILRHREDVTAVMEIGLGTNNVDVVSNMGQKGRPGASLRAFRDFLPNATIYGFDVDKRILFEEDRIKTFYLDQTDTSSFTAVAPSIPERFDLIIDDGLHSPDANVRSLVFGLSRLQVNGWIVIEDIAPAAICVWEAVGGLLPAGFTPTIIRDRGAVLFAVERVA